MRLAALKPPLHYWTELLTQQASLLCTFKLITLILLTNFELDFIRFMTQIVAFALDRV